MFSKIYTGKPFKELMRDYSNDRMQRDEDYRYAVYEALKQKREAKNGRA